MYIYLYIYIFILYKVYLRIFITHIRSTYYYYHYYCLPTANNRTITQPNLGLVLLRLTFVAQVFFARLGSQMCVE